MVKAFLAGLLFGALLQAVKIDTFEKVASFVSLKDLTVLKFLLTAVGVGTITLFPLITLGVASFHIKPLMLVGIVAGGILFGIGMALLGYCPGTAVIAIGNGALDALAGVVGGLLAGALFTLSYPFIKGLLGPYLGKPHLFFSSNWENLLLALFAGGFLISLAWFLDERQTDKRKISNKQRKDGI